MKTKLLPKLIILKSNTANSLKRDYLTLVQIVDELSKKYANEHDKMNQFIENVYLNKNQICHVDIMLNNRFFIDKMKKDVDDILISLEEAKKQKDAAYESLNNASIDLRMLEKIESKYLKEARVENNKKEQNESDRLAISTYNRVSI
jgi:flagellar export protein FliJ